MANVEFLLGMRDRARRAGDRGVAAACTADLERVGYVDPQPTAAAPVRVETAAGMETTAVRAPERAVPQPKQRPRERGKGGRPPLPRCKHGQIEGRCRKCTSGR